MNTEFTYQYPARGPGESHYRAILLGTLTAEEKRLIRQTCVGDGMTFIPNRVGLPMLAPVEKGEDDTVWHRMADSTLRDVYEEVSVDRNKITSVKNLRDAFVAIQQAGGWDEKMAALSHGWNLIPIDLATPGKPDDSGDTGERLTRASHIALFVLPNDPEDNMRAGERQEWVILRASGGRTAAQALIADHPDLLVPERPANTPLSIWIITPVHTHRFDLDTYKKGLRDKQVQEEAAEVEAVERQHLRELMARYPDEITK